MFSQSGRRSIGEKETETALGIFLRCPDRLTTRNLEPRENISVFQPETLTGHKSLLYATLRSTRARERMNNKKEANRGRTECCFFVGGITVFIDNVRPSEKDRLRVPARNNGMTNAASAPLSPPSVACWETRKKRDYATSPSIFFPSTDITAQSEAVDRSVSQGKCYRSLRRGGGVSMTCAPADVFRTSFVSLRGDGPAYPLFFQCFPENFVRTICFKWLSPDGGGQGRSDVKNKQKQKRRETYKCSAFPGPSRWCRRIVYRLRGDWRAAPGRPPWPTTLFFSVCCEPPLVLYNMQTTKKKFWKKFCKKKFHSAWIHSSHSITSSHVHSSNEKIKKQKNEKMKKWVSFWAIL